MTTAANPSAYAMPVVDPVTARGELLGSDDAPDLPMSYTGFLSHVDACVRYLAAWLGGLASGNDAMTPDSHSAERSRAQLWHWVHMGGAALDDGTPIDLALFDAAIQRVGERLPRRGMPGQEKLLQAAWLLAELTHAGKLTDIPALAPAR